MLFSTIQSQINWFIQVKCWSSANENQSVQKVAEVTPSLHYQKPLSHIMCWRSMRSWREFLLRSHPFLQRQCGETRQWQHKPHSGVSWLKKRCCRSPLTVCPSLLPIALGNLRNTVCMVCSALVWGLFPHINHTDFIKWRHTKKRNFHDNILQQLNSYFEPFLILVLKIKKCIPRLYWSNYSHYWSKIHC